MPDETKEETQEINEYLKLWFEQRNKFLALRQQKEKLESEIAKINQLMRASYALVPDEEKKRFAAWFDDYAGRLVTHQMGLTESIRGILQETPSKWFSAIEIRDRLQQGGFDFGDYTSNPLTSIHSVLKRFKAKEVKKKTMLDGTTQYRWKGPISRVGGISRPKPIENPPWIKSLRTKEEKI